MDRARELAGNFPEATSASFSGMHTGSTNLKESSMGESMPEEGQDAGTESSEPAPASPDQGDSGSNEESSSSSESEA